LSFFSSDAPSGYSFRLSGIETGTFSASSDQPIAFGTCGLRLKIDPDSRYTNSTWTVEIPNTKSATYTLNKNAYDLAVIQAGSAIDLARQEVELALADAADTVASPRSEALERADAAVAEAQATVAKFDSEVQDRVLRAPFAGTITDVDIKVGETTGTEPVMKLVTEGAFEIVARVPEIDVGKLAEGQTVELLFDAKDDEILTGEVSFVSLEATEIDGVAYFETYITLSETPDWMRGGLNADIDIVIAKTSDGVRIPKRFLQEDNGTFTVLKRIDEETYATTTIEVLLRGNDGFVAVTGLAPNDILVAP
jgi:multidrug efflux pump subunit AcrA (membrane-fusion protein)